MIKTKIVSPPFLERGDTIAIVSTARKITQREIEPMTAYLKQKGFNVITGPNMFNENNQFAGTDVERAADFNAMLADKSVKAILCSRGGYGSIRLIPHLNLLNLKASPKWIIGYSDITVFHSYLNANFDICSIHGTMPLNFTTHKDDRKSADALIQVLMGNLEDTVFKYNHLNKTGKVCGEIVGGNLSMLYSLRGTEMDIDPSGKILFIEDLDEYLYHIDRMMMNLKLGGILANLKGLIVGGMSDMNDNKVPYGKTAYEIVLEHVSEYNYPVAFSFPAGHIRPNLPIIMGKNICLEVTDLNSVMSYQ